MLFALRSTVFTCVLLRNSPGLSSQHSQDGTSSTTRCRLKANSRSTSRICIENTVVDIRLYYSKNRQTGDQGSIIRIAPDKLHVRDNTIGVPSILVPFDLTDASGCPDEWATTAQSSPQSKTYPLFSKRSIVNFQAVIRERLESCV
jgi:hypothetical protein